MARAHAVLSWSMAALIAGAIGAASAAPQTAGPARPRAVAHAGMVPTSTTPPGADSMIIPEGSADEIEIGRRIYREGIGANGQPIVGVRFGGIEATGATVACVSCHRRSGLGAVEGQDQVPPIAGRFSFSDDQRALVTMNLRNVRNFNQRHAPYTIESFAQAVRAGMHQTGRELGPIMPRYDLSDAEVRALAAYLRTLSHEWSPGVTRQRIHFATVIAPGVDPQRKQAFIDTMRAAVGQKNGNTVPGQRSMTSAAEMLLHTERMWDLDIWELEGAPETWGAQLDARQRANPAFALVSGLGDGTWQPVHDFCERSRVACWFPSVDLPPASASTDFYSLYFSRGVVLEADVLARRLAGTNPAPTRVVQIIGGDDTSRAGARALSDALTKAGSKIAIEERLVAAGDATSFTRAFAKLGKKDVVVAWLHPAEIAALAGVTPVAAPTYFSAYMANGEHAPIPAAWRSQARLVYPFELPEKRAAGLLYFQQWLGIRKLSLADEVMQSEVYFALTYLSETVAEMLDNLHTDYMVERAENMLSLRESAKAEDQAREMSIAKHQVRDGAQSAMERMQDAAARKLPRPLPGHKEYVFAKRESTTVYPRLGLAQGQRFASKGAYIVRFASAEGHGLVPESEWIIP